MHMHRVTVDIVTQSTKETMPKCTGNPYALMTAAFAHVGQNEFSSFRMQPMGSCKCTALVSIQLHSGKGAHHVAEKCGLHLTHTHTRGIHMRFCEHRHQHGTLIVGRHLPSSYGQSPVRHLYQISFRR